MKRPGFHLTIFFLCLTLLFSLAGCGEDKQAEADYIQQLNEAVKQAQQADSELSALLSSLNRSPQTTDMESLEEISEPYRKLSELDAPERFREAQERIKNGADQMLAAISQIKTYQTLLITPVDTSDAAAVDTYNQQVTSLAAQIPEQMEKASAALREGVELAQAANGQ